jgi:radical SAM protein with 4Fe4S-binding SPASM domain
VLTRELVAFGIGAWHAWLAGELGQVGRLALWPIFLKPGHEDQPDAVGHMLTPADLIAAGRQVAALRARGEPVEVGDFPLINIILLRYGVPAEDLWQCGACRSRLCVQADGTVTPCHPLRLPLGRLEPGRVGGFVARALAHPDARRMASRDYPGCRGCEHLSLCGGCRAVAAGQGLSPFDDDGSCAQVRALLGPP